MHMSRNCFTCKTLSPPPLSPLRRTRSSWLPAFSTTLACTLPSWSCTEHSASAATWPHSCSWAPWHSMLSASSSSGTRRPQLTLLTSIIIQVSLGATLSSKRLLFLRPQVRWLMRVIFCKQPHSWCCTVLAILAGSVLFERIDGAGVAAILTGIWGIWYLAYGFELKAYNHGIFIPTTVSSLFFCEPFHHQRPWRSCHICRQPGLEDVGWFAVLLRFCVCDPAYGALRPCQRRGMHLTQMCECRWLLMVFPQ